MSIGPVTFRGKATLGRAAAGRIADASKYSDLDTKAYQVLYIETIRVNVGDYTGYAGRLDVVLCIVA